MTVTLVPTQSEGSLRLAVVLDEASSGPLELALVAELNLDNATFLAESGDVNGTTETTSALQGGILNLSTSASFPASVGAGTTLFEYEFGTGGPGSINVASLLVFANGFPGSFDEPADLITVTFEGGTVQGPTDGPDVLSGTPGTEIINALAGDDVLEASAGNDQLDGGEGIDTVAFNGPRDAYTLTIATTGTVMSDRRAEGDGTDLLSNIERLTFEGDAGSQTLDLTKFGGAATLTAEEFEVIIELYIAYFNRAPDALGLNFWSTAFADGLPLSEMAVLFADQPETRETYPDGTTNTEFATAVYSNVLGRVPDAGGLAFWVDQLESGMTPRPDFILRVLEGAKADPAPDAGQEFIDQQTADQVYLDSKTDVGAFYSVHLGMSNIENARTVMETYGLAAASDEVGARNVAENFADLSDSPTDGEFLMPIVGVLVDDFSGLL